MINIYKFNSISINCSHIIQLGSRLRVQLPFARSLARIVPRRPHLRLGAHDASATVHHVLLPHDLPRVLFQQPLLLVRERLAARHPVPARGPPDRRAAPDDLDDALHLGYCRLHELLRQRARRRFTLDA